MASSPVATHGLFDFGFLTEARRHGGGGELAIDGPGDASPTPDEEGRLEPVGIGSHEDTKARSKPEGGKPFVSWWLRVRIQYRPRGN